MTASMQFPTARERVLTCGETTIGIIPDCCLVSHFQVGSWPVLYRPMQTGNIRRWGLPLMIPNFSRLKNGIFKDKNTTLPVHGFGRDFPWTVIEQDTTRLSMQLLSNDATRVHYPYEFTFTSTIVAGEGTLTYTLTMENRGEEAMPIAPGFHPYFAVAQQDKSKLITEGLPDFAATDYDWEQTIPDNPNPFPHRMTIAFPHRGRLTIAELPYEDSNGNARYLLANMQVWSDRPPKPDIDFVCFEPTVSSEDALNRPADRLLVAPYSAQQLCLEMSAVLH